METIQTKNMFNYLAESDNEHVNYPGDDDSYIFPKFYDNYESDNEIIDILTDTSENE